MAIALPLPVRVAAGLIATGFDRLRRLPEDLPALSVTAAGQAMRASMRIRQEIAELAGRGDELLSGITNPAQEHPSWAHFDENDDDSGEAPTPADDPGADNGTTIDTADDPGARTTGVDSVTRAARSAAARPTAARPTAARPTAAPPAATPPAAPAGGARQRPVPSTAAVGPADSDTPQMPGYQRMTLAQVRGRLRRLSRDSVSNLLTFEQAGAGRAPFLTLLSNRLTTLDHQPGG